MVFTDALQEAEYSCRNAASMFAHAHQCTVNRSSKHDLLFGTWQSFHASSAVQSQKVGCTVCHCRIVHFMFIAMTLNPKNLHAAHEICRKYLVAVLVTMNSNSEYLVV